MTRGEWSLGAEAQTVARIVSFASLVILSRRIVFLLRKEFSICGFRLRFPTNGCLRSQESNKNFIVE